MNESHGIEGAYYLAGIGGLEPTLECTCGEICSALTWEEAGALFDEHIWKESIA